MSTGRDQKGRVVRRDSRDLRRTVCNPDGTDRRCMERVAGCKPARLQTMVVPSFPYIEKKGVRVCLTDHYILILVLKS